MQNDNKTTDLGTKNINQHTYNKIISKQVYIQIIYCKQ